MSGLRFESMADMPPRMRELYARQAAGAAVGPHGRSTIEGSGEGHVCLLEFSGACGAAGESGGF